MSIVWFNEDASRDEIGGKGYRLCRLARAGIPVPPGFCVSVDSLEDIGVEEIECALHRLNAPAVAVRSSAVEEDSAAASFAGVYLTRLNVKGTGEVCQALADVRSSAFAPAALAYRGKCGVHGPARMAAVVQSFVMADVSGVLFQRDPVDNSDRIVIECSWGLGESVVSGAVTPDRWVVSREGTIMRSEISDKDVAVIATDAGTETVPNDSSRRRAPCIDSATICKLVTLGRSCEDLFSRPQDIEWAIASNQIWLLQSRPITYGV